MLENRGPYVSNRHISLGGESPWAYNNFFPSPQLISSCEDLLGLKEREVLNLIMSPHSWTLCHGQQRFVSTISSFFSIRQTFTKQNGWYSLELGTIHMSTKRETYTQVWHIIDWNEHSSAIARSKLLKNGKKKKLWQTVQDDPCPPKSSKELWSSSGEETAGKWGPTTVWHEGPFVVAEVF